MVDQRRFAKLCDYREGLEPNENLLSYWPLTYNATDMPAHDGEITDLAATKLRAKMREVSKYSNAVWLPMS